MGKEEDKRVNDMKGSRRDDDVTVRERVCTATKSQFLPLSATTIVLVRPQDPTDMQL